MACVTAKTFLILASASLNIFIPSWEQRVKFALSDLYLRDSLCYRRHPAVG